MDLKSLNVAKAAQKGILEKPLLSHRGRGTGDKTFLCNCGAFPNKVLVNLRYSSPLKDNDERERHQYPEECPL